MYTGTTFTFMHLSLFLISGNSEDISKSNVELTKTGNTCKRKKSLKSKFHYWLSIHISDKTTYLRNKIEKKSWRCLTCYIHYGAMVIVRNYHKFIFNFIVSAHLPSLCVCRRRPSMSSVIVVRCRHRKLFQLSSTCFF